MTMNLLPEGAELRLAGVRLPPGRPVYAGYGSGGTVAWATTEPVPDAGRVWAALSVAHQDTGLVPFLASSMDRYPRRPWDDGEFEDPADTNDLGLMDAAAILQSGWENYIGVLPEEDDKYWRAGRVPFSRAFPGLAPREDAALGRQQVDEILGSLPRQGSGLRPPAGPPTSFRGSAIPGPTATCRRFRLPPCCGRGKTGSARVCCGLASTRSSCWPSGPRTPSRRPTT